MHHHLPAAAVAEALVLHQSAPALPSATDARFVRRCHRSGSHRAQSTSRSVFPAPCGDCSVAAPRARCPAAGSANWTAARFGPDPGLVADPAVVPAVVLVVPAVDLAVPAAHGRALIPRSARAAGHVPLRAPTALVRTACLLLRWPRRAAAQPD